MRKMPLRVLFEAAFQLRLGLFLAWQVSYLMLYLEAF
jgi:hypothetical protein